MAKSQKTPDHCTCMSFLDITFKNHKYVVEATTAAALLGKLSTRSMSVSVRICAHLAKREFVRHRCWTRTAPDH